MPTKDVNDVIRIGCSVAYGVTNLAIDFPHGGTSLGVVGGPPVWQVAMSYHTENGADDKLAGSPTGVRFTGARHGLGLTLRQWDPALFAAIFRNYLTSAGEVILTDHHQATGNLMRPGDEVPTLGNLLVSPTNPDHPGLLFYDVRPIVAEEEMHFSAINEHTINVGFMVMPVAVSGGLRLFQKGILSKLTLT